MDLSTIFDVVSKGSDATKFFEEIFKGCLLAAGVVTVDKLAERYIKNKEKGKSSSESAKEVAGVAPAIVASAIAHSIAENVISNYGEREALIFRTK